MSWQDAVERTVSGLGYDLVDATKSAGGLLRVFIDHLPPEPAAVAPFDRFITVDDCEKVTRQLQHVLEVDSIAYERLEVSSPGLDRPLKKPADYARFAGEQVELTLKVPFKGRKKFAGQLAANDAGWRLLLADGAAVKPGSTGGGRKKAASRPPAGAPTGAAGAASEAQSVDFALDFSFDEVRDAHLVPVVDFKGRRSAAPSERNDAAGFLPPPVAGAHPNDEVDGGRIQ